MNGREVARAIVDNLDEELEKEKEGGHSHEI